MSHVPDKFIITPSKLVEPKNESPKETRRNLS